jgi:hypothetical protein
LFLWIFWIIFIPICISIDIITTLLINLIYIPLWIIICFNNLLLILSLHLCRILSFWRKILASKLILYCPLLHFLLSILSNITSSWSNNRPIMCWFSKIVIRNTQISFPCWLRRCKQALQLTYEHLHTIIISIINLHLIIAFND